jgi:hypothetical protein
MTLRYRTLADCFTFEDFEVEVSGDADVDEWERSATGRPSPVWAISNLELTVYGEDAGAIEDFRFGLAVREAERRLIDLADEKYVASGDVFSNPEDFDDE